jgi:hypothetical protein
MPKADPFGIAIVLVIAMLVLAFQATTTLVHAFGASSGKRHGS